MIYIKLKVTACIQECPAEMNSGFHLFQRHCFVSLLSSHLHRQSLLNHPLVCFRSLIYWSLYVELSISCCAANHCHRIHSFRQIKHLSNLLDSARVRTFPMIPLLLLALSADLQLSAHLPDWQFFWEKRLECPVSKQSHFCAGDWADLLVLDLLKDLMLEFLQLLLTSCSISACLQRGVMSRH